jgi:hypothetical protein
MVDTAIIERAREVRIEDELARRGIKLRGRASDAWRQRAPNPPPASADRPQRPP